MSSDPRDPSTWRLATQGNSREGTQPVPYRRISQNGWFMAEEAEAFERYLIPADRLMDFITESFPDPYTRTYNAGGGIILPQVVYPLPRKMPPLPRFRTKKVSWESQVEGKPVDPFGADTDAPEGTYHGLLHVDIEYSTEYDNDETDPEDPKTYLEINANASGEFISSSSPSATWASDGSAASDQNMAATVTVPTTEWSIRWSRIPWSFFNGTLIARLRARLGTVNSSALNLIYGAAAETVLFAGYTYAEQRTFRSTGVSGQPPIVIDLKLIEKAVTTKDGTAGHNHFWRPTPGIWDRLLVDGTNPVYASTDLNQIF